MKLSIVVTVYNEEENIRPLAEKLEDAIVDIDYEIIYVDDGSTDSTVEAIKALNWNKIRLVELNRNYGQSNALVAGIDEAKGEFIATLDGDLQNDPADIMGMLHKAEHEQWDLVTGIRVKRKDGFFLKKIPSKLGNWLIRTSTGLKMKDYGCTLKVFRSETAKSISLYGELHRYITVLAYLQGARISQVNVRHHHRIHGKSKYGLNRTLRVMSDLLLMLFFKKYMQRPMHLFGGGGLILLFVGVALNLYLFVLKLMGQDIWGKPLLILAAIAFIGGLQLITAGIITEMVMRTYYESQNKKQYTVKKIWRFENTNSSLH